MKVDHLQGKKIHGISIAAIAYLAAMNIAMKP